MDSVQKKTPAQILGEKITAKQKLLGERSKAIWAEANLPRRLLWAAKKGDSRRISLETAVRIADVLDISLDEIVKEHRWQRTSKT